MVFREKLRQIRNKAAKKVAPDGSSRQQAGRVAAVARQGVRRAEEVVGEGSVPRRAEQAPRDEREMFAAAHENAQAGAPVDATLDPLSGPEQTHELAGGTRRGQIRVDEMAFSESGGSGEDAGMFAAESMLNGHQIEGEDPLAMDGLFGPPEGGGE